MHSFHVNGEFEDRGQMAITDTDSNGSSSRFHTTTNIYETTEQFPSFWGYE